MGEALGGGGSQSLFGGGANVVMTKISAVGAAMFMVTCLSLAALSTARGRSIIDQIPFTSEGLPFELPTEAGTPPQAGSPTGVPGAAGGRPTTSDTVPDVVPDVRPVTPIVGEEMAGRTDKKPRDFLRVHRKGGEPCPVCGSAISEVSPSNRVTSFCRTCQPGLTQF